MATKEFDHQRPTWSTPPNEVYNSDPFDTVRVLHCGAEAKCRIKPDSTGGYHYIPSAEYLEYKREMTPAPKKKLRSL
jgi:hypothetical protein